jgi:uncharacterized protein DUF1844
MGRCALYRAILDKSKEIAPLCAGVVYSATYGEFMDEEKGFIIRDRRGVESESVEKTDDTAAQAQAAKPAEPAPKPPVPPINFLSFVYSLATSALMCLGEPVGEGAAGQAPNLAQAQEIIDILTMLESKTKGNLAAEEETLLQEMLYTLRIKFVERAKARKS